MHVLVLLPLTASQRTRIEGAAPGASFTFIGHGHGRVR